MSAALPPVRAWLWLASAALAVASVIAADTIRAPPQPDVIVPPLDPAELRPGYGPATFADALADADREVAGRRKMLTRDWLPMEALARALTARYRLTGNAADLAEADRLLDLALNLSPWPAGPALSRAEVALARHDLDAAEQALARFDAAAMSAPVDERAEAASLRCEIAFQRGQAAEARRLCVGSSLSTELRRANLLAKTGRPEQAARIVEDLVRRPRLPPATLATLALQRASIALAMGDWQASGKWARAAERLFPGAWLAEAFVAQQHALEGDRAEARRRYGALAERTGHPEVLDALARLAEADGQVADARRWAARAGLAWEERARQLPETYATHYAEHLLLNGEPRRALALAEADYRRRPFPATATHYAFALWRNGDPARTLEVVRNSERSGFLTAEMKLAEAVALGSLGRAAEAGEAMSAARRLNPRIDSTAQQYVVFGRD